MSARPSAAPEVRLAEMFTTSATGLAGGLCRASRPLLPVLQGRMLRLDELSVTAGLERQSPLAAAVMALGPAVSAVGAGVAAIGGLGAAEATAMAGVAESVVEVGLDALEAIEVGARIDDSTVDFAHRLANATHLASTLAGGPRAISRRPWSGGSPRAPALWPVLLEALSTRIQVKQHWKHGPGSAAWVGRVEAASACRDAALHGMRAHAAAVATRAASSTERLLRCLTFAALYCGFAMLHRPPWAVDGVAVRAESATERVAVPIQLRRVVYPFRPEGSGVAAF
ncbi:MAG: hypothetical protein ABR977_04515 [Candidatus Dormibacteria bacterium]